MARIRTVKPDLFKSRTVSLLTYRARLTWIGLWTVADDCGRLRNDPRVIAGELWPQEDDVTWVEVEADVAELVENGKLCRYSVGGDEFLHIPNWTDHQKISKPSPSRLPEPKCREHSANGAVGDDSGNTPGGLPDGKGKGKGSGKEGEGEYPTPPNSIPSQFCPAHPTGTDSRCRGCGDARRALDAWLKAPTPQPTVPTPPRRLVECALHPNYPLPCDRCVEERAA